MTEEEYNKMLQPLGTFSTIKAFWEYWSNIMETKNFPDASTLYLFKEGIRPMWEDPQNIHGGKLQSVLPKSVSHQVWSDLVLSAIGEQLDSEDQVCGIVLSTRPRGNAISVWVRHDHHEDPRYTHDYEVISQHFLELLDAAGGGGGG
eukprot:CAMPEP_0172155008 /NCGR_PEP_ID=MMETSP1050-20130122/2377_1 /TAXON_ID=233186 /ORGANISM="Cryptomonas curvata, Strain CCAP979/52" /LENGTH=146 /DNA_ID=CAMNT_0012823839 /DNA_START=224 /DNA_END=661 /DNA_ORIENTATION=-